MCRLTDSLRPTDRLMRALLAPALVFIATAIDRNYQTDLWHHLARGRAYVETGVLLDEDCFTFTVAGTTFRDVNWLWQIVFYHLFRFGGLPLVQTTNSAALAVTFGLLFAFARQRSGSNFLACGVSVAAFLGIWPLLLIRPQTFSLLLFVVLQIVLDEAHARPRWLFVVPLILALWVNLHGGFPVGLVLVAAHGLAAIAESLSSHGSPSRAAMMRAASPWLLCIALSLAATLANPYGWHVYEYVGATASRAASRRIDEWLPPGLDSLTGIVWAGSVAALLLLSAGKQRPALRDVILLCCFFPLSCSAIRMVAWWLLLVAPILAAQLAQCFPGLLRADRDDDRATRSAATLCGMLAVAVVLSLPWLERYNPVLRLPGRGRRTECDLQAIADRLRDRGPGRIFTRFAWGEYLGWSLATDYRVFLDGRIEIFPDEVWAEYAAVTRGRADWEAILDAYRVDWLLLDRGGYHGELLPLVGRSPRWHLVDRAGDALLFARSTSAP